MLPNASLGILVFDRNSLACFPAIQIHYIVDQFLPKYVCSLYENKQLATCDKLFTTEEFGNSRRKLHLLTVNWHELPQITFLSGKITRAALNSAK